ncbi:EboA domain-containing protein [Streptomyces sp. NPDC004250]|uniref:EboA domain-containing protein n=1 Tax=Streptomyces sp. NPDC004250 TaxID=3364692 RepID=UPI0036A51C2F
MLTIPGPLLARLTPESAAWLNDALHEAVAAAHAPGPGRVPAWELRFAAAGRRCGSLENAEAARVLLLHAAHPGPATTVRLFQQGTADERRAVLRALPHLAIAPEEGVPLIEDALRTNDTRLVAAALGPYAAAYLPAHAWRHAVLKCLFTGVSAGVVAGLADRARGDTELGRMLRDFAAERTAAGRPVPDDLRHLLALTAKESRCASSTPTST